MRRRPILTVFLAFTGLMVIWWNQPYFGYSYCLLGGIKSEFDYLEDLRSKVLLKVNNKSYHGYDAHKKYLNIMVPAINKAFDMMRECIAKRGIQYCRYVGPDEEGAVRTDQDPHYIPYKERYKYRYIVKKSDVEMVILPWGDMPGYYPGGYYLNVDDLKNNEYYELMNVCFAGCSPNHSSKFPNSVQAHVSGRVYGGLKGLVLVLGHALGVA